MFAALRGLVCGLAAAAAATAQAEDYAARYHASWAGLPAGEIALSLHEDQAGYHDEIRIRSIGMPRLLIGFRGHAVSDGRRPAMPRALPTPRSYEAVYDLRRRHDRHLSLRFAGAIAGTIAERGPGDTSRRPPLAPEFRRNALDPLSALSALREALRAGERGVFTVPVFDGARRFDVVARVLPKPPGEPSLRLELTLRPIAGFKGESSDDGDPDSAPRPVQLTMSDDARLMPLAMRVPLYYLPLEIGLDRWCGTPAACAW